MPVLDMPIPLELENEDWAKCPLFLQVAEELK
jgi:hypothetical protein